MFPRHRTESNRLLIMVAGVLQQWCVFVGALADGRYAKPTHLSRMQPNTVFGYMIP